MFAHELEKSIPETRLLELESVSASPEGLLFKGRKILTESFAFPSHLDEWKRRSVMKFFFSNYALRKRRKFEGKAVWVIDDWSNGYFHWVTDVLSRIFTVKDMLSDAVVPLPPRFKSLGFVLPSLAPFKQLRVEFMREDEVLLFDKLLLPTHVAPSGHYNEKIIRGVREILVNFYGSAPAEEANDRVYISRSRAPKRRIANESEVAEVLSEFDFEIVHAEDCSFEEQVRVASGARYIVSNHGAGLTNMLFMNAGGSVLELRHESDRINNCYFTLASALELSYFYQTCTPVVQGEDPHTADLRVDAKRLRENLRLMLGV